MTLRSFILSLLLVFTLTLPTIAQEQKESVYDRVMRTGTIRCGYYPWDIYLTKEPNTGKMGGIYYDYMEQLGKNLGLKIEWTEEVGVGDFVAALENDRVDAFCTAVTYAAQRGRQADFLTPIFYVASSIVARKDDIRFDGHQERLNDSKITLTTFEGDIFDKISNTEFPKTKKFQIPQISTAADLYMTVATGKTDATITDTSSSLQFMQTNPGKLRLVKLNDGGVVFRAFPASISIKGGEYRFQRMLEIATVEMMASGAIEAILKKHEKYPGTLLRVAKPYQTHILK